MYQVYFQPEKHWWEFWKHDRYLINGKDYEIVNGYFILKKALKGKTVITYNIALNRRAMRKQHKKALIGTNGISKATDSC